MQNRLENFNFHELQIMLWALEGYTPYPNDADTIAKLRSEIRYALKEIENEWREKSGGSSYENIYSDRYATHNID